MLIFYYENKCHIFLILNLAIVYQFWATYLTGNTNIGKSNNHFCSYHQNFVMYLRKRKKKEERKKGRREEKANEGRREAEWKGGGEV